jgi:hypothetical protein
MIKVPSSTFQKYAWQVCRLLILLFATVGILNWWIDPYRLFFKGDLYADTSLKPRPRSNEPQIKGVLAMTARPEVLIIGNSRAEIGFNPKEISEKTGLRVFNLGLAGFQLRKSTTELDSILSLKTVKVALIGIDFWDYINDLGSPSEDPSMPQLPTSERLVSRGTKLAFESLFSSTAVMDSVRTLNARRSLYPETLTSLGFNPMLDFKGHTKTSGYFATFMTGDVPVRKRFNEVVQLYKNRVPENSVPFSSTRDIVAKLQKNGVKVILFTYPIHVSYLDMIDSAGLWQDFDTWYNAIVTLGVNKNGQKVADVYDFTCGSSMGLEKIPSKGDRTSVMKYYWDSGHFKSTVGNEIASELLTPRDGGIRTLMTKQNASSVGNACRSLLKTFRFSKSEEK